MELLELTLEMELRRCLNKYAGVFRASENFQSNKFVKKVLKPYSGT